MNAQQRAQRMVLRVSDLPGEGWVAGTAAAEAVAAGEPDPVDECLGGFPDHAVRASAESPPFRREQALAFSVAWVLEDPRAAESAWALLAGDAFVSCFADALVATVVRADSPADGGAELLGHGGPEIGGLAAPAGHAALARARLSAGTPGGVLVIHLDVVALELERAVSAIFLADSPDAIPGDVVSGVAHRVAGRMG